MKQFQGEQEGPFSMFVLLEKEKEGSESVYYSNNTWVSKIRWGFKIGKIRSWEVQDSLIVVTFQKSFAFPFYSVVFCKSLEYQVTELLSHYAFYLKKYMYI